MPIKEIEARIIKDGRGRIAIPRRMKDQPFPPKWYPKAKRVCGLEYQ
jgi:hypothetical protein